MSVKGENISTNKKTENQIVAIIVLYNPDLEIKKRFNELRSEFDKLIYVDNSDNDTEYAEIIKEIKENESIDYYYMGGNVGLSRALDFGCNKAIEFGYRYALLFDQDTHISSGFKEKMQSKIGLDNKVALIAPNIYEYYHEKGKLILRESPIYPKVDDYTKFAITSGSLLDLKIYSQLGGFDEQLFIMNIDQDYCCKLWSNGYKIFRNGHAFIYQEPGNLTLHKIFNRIIRNPNYSATRYWYLFRNERYCRRKWGENYLYQRVCLWKYVIVIILFDNQNKLLKLVACFKGWREGANIKLKNSELNDQSPSLRKM